MSDVKLCKDCKHYIAGRQHRYGSGCMARYREDVVTGWLTYASANSMRENSEGCGQAAKLFEPKPPTKWHRLVQFLTSTEHK